MRNPLNLSIYSDEVVPPPERIDARVKGIVIQVASSIEKQFRDEGFSPLA